jgi:hypothetical protein
MVVLKDAQMLGALIAASGIVAHYKLAGRRVPFVAAASIAVLIAYATLVRTNAVFATAPFAILLCSRPKSLALRIALIAATALVVVGLTPFINHRLLGAQPSTVAKSQPVFDLAAIAVATPGSPNVFTSSELQQIAARHCVKAFFWDPLGEPTACGPAAERLMARPQGELYHDLARAALAHPIAYAEHRIRHWNSTERWLVAPGLPDEAPPIEAEPNDVGLGTPPSAVAASWQSLAALEGETPLGWPIVWTAISLCLLPAAWRVRSRSAGGLAFALVVSALAIEASFLFVSIASDLRYHLWAMAAAPLALILLAEDFEQPRRSGVAGAAFVALLILGGVIARASLPRAPDSYEGMIHSVSG